MALKPEKLHRSECYVCVLLVSCYIAASEIHLIIFCRSCDYNLKPELVLFLDAGSSIPIDPSYTPRSNAIVLSLGRVKISKSGILLNSRLS